MSEKSRTPENDVTQTSTGQSHLLAEGRLLAGRYRIGDVLGLGGMGMVYRARDETLNIDVALKVLRDDLSADAESRTLDRFQQELVLARQVSHRNVVRIHDIGRDDDVYFLTMDLVEGRSLKDILEEKGTLSVARALDITRQLALGLAAAHEMGVVHRDLKPANILVDKDKTPYITDFGVARSAANKGLTRTGHIVGTPDYLSPEQARGGELDGRSDIYSLGLILYEMLSGQLPFSGETFQEVLAQRAMGKPRDLAEIGVTVPPAVKRIIEHCLARDPADRYDNAMQLAQDLGEGQATQVMRKRRGNQARNAIAVLGLVLLAAGAIGTGFWIYSKAPTRPASGGETAQAVKSGIVIMPLQDATGRSDLQWLRTGLPELAADQLGDNQALQLVDPNRVLQTLADLNMIDGPGTAAELRQAGELLGAEQLVTGTIRSAGQAIRIDARLTDINEAPGGSKSFSVEVASDGQVFDLVSRFAEALQQQLALPASADLSEARLSTSQSALRAYTEGTRLLYLGSSVQAAPMLEQAVAADPEFAAAWLRLSEAYEMLGFGDKSVQAIQNASNLLADSGSRTALEARAREAILTGDLERAQTALATLVERFPGDSEARVALALAHEDEGELEQAMTVLEKVLSDDPNHPRAWYLMGKYAILTGDIQSAIDDYLVRALVIQNRLGNEQGRADVLNAMGIAYFRLGQLQQAEDHYRQAADIRSRIGDERGVAASRSNIARILVSQGKFEEARAEFLQAMASREAIGDRPGVAVLHNEIGLLEENRGRYSEALSSYRQALQIRRQLGNKRALAESYSNVGFAYYTLGEYDNASVYWQQALDTALELENQEDIVLARQNIALLDFVRGRWDEALKGFVETLDEARNLANPRIAAVSHGNLGRLALYQGRFVAAERSLAEAIEILAGLDDSRGEVEYRLFRAQLRLALNQPGETQTELEAIAGLIGERGNREQLARLANLRGQLAVKSGKQNASESIFEEALVFARDSGNAAVQLQVQLAAADAWLAAGRLKPQETEKLVGAAASIGHVPLQLTALELAAMAALDNAQSELAERHARQWLRQIQSVDIYEGSWRAYRVLGSALDQQGKQALAAPIFEKAKSELARLQQYMDEPQWQSFSALPAVQELTDVP